MSDLYGAVRRRTGAGTAGFAGDASRVRAWLGHGWQHEWFHRIHVQDVSMKIVNKSLKKLGGGDFGKHAIKRLNLGDSSRTDNFAQFVMARR